MKNQQEARVAGALNAPGALAILPCPPFRSASLLWQPRNGAFTLTVICKATFTLFPGECRMVDDGDPPYEADVYWNDDARRSLREASDRVPFKRHADVILVGHAYAPRARPVPSLMTRLVAAGVDKLVEVHGDRTWTPEGHLREGSAFVRMPLVWERAAGGPGTLNPAGVQPNSRQGRSGQVAIPNLQPPGFYLRRREDMIPTVGFGPIAPSWPSRRANLHHYAEHWDEQRWADHPLPQNVDAAFFNAAPPDQQVKELRSNERIWLENLHPEYPRLSTNLPGISPRAVIVRSGAPQPLRMRCDTLLIDTDRGLCSLSWRGQIALARADEQVQVLISLDQAHRDGATETLVGGLSSRAILPFRSSSTPAGAPPAPERASQPNTASLVGIGRAERDGAPYHDHGVPVASGHRPEAQSEVNGTETLVPAFYARAAALPFSVKGIEMAPPALITGPPLPSLLMPSDRTLSAAPISTVEPERKPPQNEAPTPPAWVGPLAERKPDDQTRASTESKASSSDGAVRVAKKGENAHPAATLSTEADPVELSIERFSAISAELAEGRVARAEVLRGHELTECEWSANQQHWSKALEEERLRGSSHIRVASDRAYVEAVEGFRGPVTLPDYARIMIALERGQPNLTLDDLKIQRAALMPIVRLWTRKVASDAKLSEEVRALLFGSRGA